ncbi:Uma2 family endonuclease [Synechocystis sp. LKSZ1]|uniref:Uma2 family endonuclease n=1 Tax=Synechocystis sp. LKSZ1 TaxID=3144951 RepID=UPI00336C1989
MTSTMTRRKISLKEYYWLTEQGFFREQPRVELIKGEIIEMIAKGTAYTFCTMQLLRLLSASLPESLYLRCQDPIGLSASSEPEPDFAIVRERKDHYLSSHPTPADILWLIEIADSSLNYDRDVKLALYAEAQIPEYWIVNLLDRQLEVYSQPYARSHQGFGYRQCLIYLPDQAVPLPSLPDLSLPLELIFPVSA